MNRRVSFLGSILLLMISFSVNGQSQLPGFLKRAHLGISYTSTSTDVHGLVFVKGDDIARYEDFSTTLKSKNAFGFAIGTSIPIARLNDYMILAISTELSYQNLRWEGLKVPLHKDLTVKSLTAVTGLPTGIDLKFGCVAPKYASRLAGTIGLGAFPMYSTTFIEKNENSITTISPYLKAEVGFFCRTLLQIQDYVYI